MADDYTDPTVVVGGNKNVKELARATKIMGAAWVAAVSAFRGVIFCLVLRYHIGCTGQETVIDEL